MGQSEYWTKFLERRLSRRRVIQTGALTGAGLWAGSAFGCGSGSSSGGATTQTPGPASRQPASQTQPPAAAKIQRGGKLRVVTGLDASSLDAQTGISGGDYWYWFGLYDNLVAFDKDYVSRPDISLAEGWETPDPKTMVFHLRKGVKFHDDTPFNAQAVKFNIERVLDPATKSLGRSQLLAIDKVEVVDDYTVKFLLNQPSAALLSNLGDRGGAMNSPTAVQKWGDQYGSHPVGTGPFQFVEWVRGSQVVMKRNENYWGKDKDGNQLPYLDELRVFVIPDATVSLANLQSGDADIVGLQAKDLDTVKKNKNLAVVDMDGAGEDQVLIFNQAKPPMDDVNLRLAVAHAINADAINQAVYFGDETIAKGGMWPVGTWVYDDTVPRPFYDQKKAKEYLAKAGKPNGFSMSMMTYQNATQVQAMEMMKAQLAEVGINVELNVLEVSQGTTAFFVDGAYPFYITGWNRRPEPDQIASMNFKSDGYYNPGKLKNPELDALIEKGSSTYDIQERKKIYRQIQEKVAADGNWFPLFYRRNHVGYNAKLQNMTTTFWGGDAMPRYKELWINQ